VDLDAEHACELARGLFPFARIPQSHMMGWAW